MRKILMVFGILILFSSAAYAETIKATVDGMVCAFCATSIEKTFMKNPAVESVDIDLEKHLVTIHLKKGQPLDDAGVKEVIEYSGYTLGPIVREK